MRYVRSFVDRSAGLTVAGFGLMAVLLAISLWLATGQRRDDAMVAHTLEVQFRLMRVQSALKDAETGQRGFVITGDPAFLAPYKQARRTIDVELAALQRSVADNPAQAAGGVELRRLAYAHMEGLGAGLAARRTQGLGAAAALMAQGNERAAMDRVRRQVSLMIEAEQRLLDARRVRSARTAAVLKVILVLGFAVLVVLSIYAIRDAEQRLARVAENRDALEAANRALRAESQTREAAEAQVRQMQKMEALGQLTGGVAHDFNNMLAIIIGGLDMARRRLREAPDKAEAYIVSALEGAERAATLTARLLAFARQQPLDPKALDVNRLIANLSDMLRRTLVEGVEIETVLAGGLWRANIDASQLENAILNLCVNARDAMAHGGRLTIETGNAYLDESYAKAHPEVAPGQYVLIAVTDTGDGMAEDVLSRVFEPFFTTKAPGRGTGLGLSQVFGFIKQSGGHVKIYSEPGDGTSVKLYLPRSAGEDTEAPDVAEEAVMGAGEAILVVEDDEQVRRMSVEALRLLGYRVAEAASPEQALRVLAETPVDLMFTDVVMPGMSGRVLADRAGEIRPGLKVLYTTGYTRNAVVHNGVLDRGVALLPKPFTLEQLSRKISQTLAD